MRTGKKSLIPVLRATRVIKRDGTLLMRPLMRDGGFLLSVDVIFLERFGTPFHIQSIVVVSKGFHVNIQEVTCRAEAEYLVDEQFTLPEKNVPTETTDTLLDRVVYFEDKKIGVITAWQETPIYTLLVVTGKNQEWLIPFTSAFIKIDEEKIILLNGAVIEN